MTARQETPRWNEVYGADEQLRRRREAMPAKLEALGLSCADRSARILDLACGHGEALDAMSAMGFRDLHGMDLTVPPSLAADTRFRVLQGDAMATGYSDAMFDWVFCLHAMHHLAGAENVDRFLKEAYRILKPGGCLGIIDFPSSVPVRTAFWLFRRRWFLRTPYLKWFGAVIAEEWPFLKDYLPQWPRVRRLLLQGPFKVLSHRRKPIYFYLTLQKEPRLQVRRR